MTPSSVELIGFWMAKGIVQYQKNFKRQFLTGKVLPEFRDKASIKPVQKNISHCSGFLVVQSKDWQLVSIFSLQGLGVSSFIDKGSLEHKPNCICTKQKPIPSCLKSGAHFSSLLINVLCGIFSFSSMILIFFLLNDFLNGIWELICCLLVGRSCFSCYLDIFLKNLFIN